MILEGPSDCYQIACAIRALYMQHQELQMRSVHYLHKNRHIGGSGGMILEGFGASGVDLQEPGNDFCGFEFQKPSELSDFSELLELSKFLDFFRTFRTYKTSIWI